MSDIKQSLYVPYSGPASLSHGLDVAALGPVPGLIETAATTFNHEQVRTFWRDRLNAWSDRFKQRRKSGRFCYFTGTNRTNEKQMMETLVRSARNCGVTEDIHAFSPHDVEGAINHFSPATRDWKNHFAKMDFLKELYESHPDYDYYVWLDSDTVFVRDPGDLRELLRDNKVWVSMEAELTSPENKHHGWQHVEKNHLIQWMRELGCGEKVYNTNGGMFIVRNDAVPEFHAKAFELRQAIDSRANNRIDDEVVLAILGQTMATDYENNRFEKHKHIWAPDWNHAWSDEPGKNPHTRNKLPDGSDWKHMDWLTGADMGMVNPAIVHCMRCKGLMGGPGWRWQGQAPKMTPVHRMPIQNLQPVPVTPKEPVGTKLAEIFAECGVQRPPNCDCNQWTIKMNQGIEWCQTNRRDIVTHLNDAVGKAGWLAMAKVGLRGYLSVDSLIDEAIKRAASV